jgi:hypothetical protein
MSSFPAELKEKNTRGRVITNGKINFLFTKIYAAKGVTKSRSDAGTPSLRD